MVRTHGEPRNLLVWGGVATPEAAAAFLAVGCKGIVFESLHWLTDLCAVDQTVRDKISVLRPDHTDLVGLDLHVPCRLFNKGNSLADEGAEGTGEFPSARRNPRGRSPLLG